MQACQYGGVRHQLSGDTQYRGYVRADGLTCLPVARFVSVEASCLFYGWNRVCIRKLEVSDCSPHGALERSSGRLDQQDIMMCSLIMIYSTCQSEPFYGRKSRDITKNMALNRWVATRLRCTTSRHQILLRTVNICTVLLYNKYVLKSGTAQ